MRQTALAYADSGSRSTSSHPLEQSRERIQPFGVNEHVVVLDNLIQRRDGGELLLGQIPVHTVSASSKETNKLSQLQSKPVKEPGVDFADDRRTMRVNRSSCATKREELRAFDIAFHQREPLERRQILVERHDFAHDTCRT